ncbi:hypothetical protein TKK_0018928 [Trichogramma kaykai]
MAITVKKRRVAIVGGEPVVGPLPGQLLDSESYDFARSNSSNSNARGWGPVCSGPVPGPVVLTERRPPPLPSFVSPCPAAPLPLGRMTLGGRDLVARSSASSSSSVAPCTSSVACSTRRADQLLSPRLAAASAGACECAPRPMQHLSRRRPSRCPAVAQQRPLLLPLLLSPCRQHR